MPLNERDPSDKARDSNIQELIKAGHKPEQAVAIAYDIQRKASKVGGGSSPAANKIKTKIIPQ